MKLQTGDLKYYPAEKPGRIREVKPKSIAIIQENRIMRMG